MLKLKAYISVLFALIICCGCPSSTNKVDTTDNTVDSLKAKPQNPSIQLITSRIEKDTTNAELYFNRANFYLQDKEVGYAAADILKAMELDPSQAKYYLLAKDILVESGDGEAAIKILENGLGQLENNVDLLTEKAKMHFYMRQYSPAMITFAQTLKLDPTNPDIYFFMGFTYKETNKIEKAIKSFEKAIEFNPDFYEAIMQLGLLHSQNNNDLCISYFDNALRLDPQSTEALYAKGLHYHNNEKFDKALATYRNILDIDRQNHLALFNMGHIYYNQSVIDTALQHFNMVVGVKPEYADAYQMRALCHEAQNNFDKALKDYTSALNLNPEHEAAKLGMERVKNKISS